MTKQKNPSKKGTSSAKENTSGAIPMGSTTSVNNQFADNFFKKVFETKEAIQDLLRYVGEPIPKDAKIEILFQHPVLIGNRSNDLAFLLNLIFYYFFEQQSTESFNLPVRFLLYIARAIENYIAERNGNLYGKTRLLIPEIKSYAIFTGVEEKPPTEFRTVQRLSDSYLTKPLKENIESQPSFSFELCVICYNMRTTYQEMEQFIQSNIIPERLNGIENVLVQYAMFINSVKYELFINQVTTNTDKAKQIILKICNLFLERGYLVFYFTDQEVIHMTLEQLSAEEVIRFQEREVGIEIGRKEGRKEGKEDHLKELVTKKIKKGKSLVVIAEELEEEESTIQQIMKEIKIEV